MATSSHSEQAGRLLGEAGQFALAILCHVGLDKLLTWAYPEREGFLHAFRLFVFLCFMVCYVTQVISIVATLAPWTTTATNRFLESLGRQITTAVDRRTAPQVLPPGSVVPSDRSRSNE